MTDEEQANIRRLIAAIDKAYNKPKELIWRAFLVGLLSGLGATVGVAVILAVLGLIVKKLGGIPVIGDWLNNVNEVFPRSRY